LLGVFNLPWNTFFRRIRDVESSRRKLLNAVAGAEDLTFVRSWGNIGDHLIYAGTRQLLAEIPYTEISVRDVERAQGHTALLSGGGAWCQPFHEVLPAALPLIEERFERVIVLPSSFDVSVNLVRETLASTKALVFARERVSFDQIRDLCQADIALDCAFFFDFRPYHRSRRRGSGLLRAYRSDRESQQHFIPSDNNDISVTCESLDEWLWTIMRHETVETDRAHVMIAAALLGKCVEYQASSYHKIPAIAEFALSGFPVRRQSLDHWGVGEGRI